MNFDDGSPFLTKLGHQRSRKLRFHLIHDGRSLDSVEQVSSEFPILATAVDFLTPSGQQHIRRAKLFQAEFLFLLGQLDNRDG